MGVSLLGTLGNCGCPFGFPFSRQKKGVASKQTPPHESEHDSSWLVLSPPCGEYVAGLPSGPWSSPHVVREDKPACEVFNDLKAAVEVDVGLGEGWQVRYPNSETVSVRLRDEPRVAGSRSVAGGRWLLSQDIGQFSVESAKFIQEEERASERESQLRQNRQEEVAKELNGRVYRALLRRQKCLVVPSILITSMFLGSMVFCAVKAFDTTPDQLQAVGLSVAALFLWWCSCVGFNGIWFALPDAGERQDFETAVHSALLALQCGLRQAGLRLEARSYVARWHSRHRSGLCGGHHGGLRLCGGGCDPMGSSSCAAVPAASCVASTSGKRTRSGS